MISKTGELTLLAQKEIYIGSVWMLKMTTFDQVSGLQEGLWWVGSPEAGRANYKRPRLHPSPFPPQLYPFYTLLHLSTLCSAPHPGGASFQFIQHTSIAIPDKQCDYHIKPYCSIPKQIETTPCSVAGWAVLKLDQLHHCAGVPLS